MLLSRRLLSQTALPPEEALPSPRNAMPSTPLTGLFRGDGWRKGEKGRRKQTQAVERSRKTRGHSWKGHSPQILEGMGRGAGGDGAPQPRELPVA